METPELFQTCCYNAAQFAPESAKNGDNFVIEELLDFPNDDSMAEGDGGLEAALTAGTSTDSSTGTTVNDASSFCGGGGTVEQHVSPADVGGGRGFAGGQFASELCVPYDDLAELEWLSNFEEESFSSEDLQKLQLIQGVKARTNEANSHFQQYPFQPEITQPGPITNVPAKARSKRSRVAPGNWTSRLLAVSPTPPPPPATVIPAVSSESESVVTAAKKAAKPVSHKKKEGAGNAGGEGRRCLHCATDKTPQWRTGPMGPKTLCNACGVRYKSGRLVPEYRPAASPTFVLTKHSNSHRKVLELRRQKEMMRAQQQQQEQQYMHHSSNHLRSVMFDQAPSNGEDYLIHQHIGPDFGQMMI